MLDGLLAGPPRWLNMIFFPSFRAWVFAFLLLAASAAPLAHAQGNASLEPVLDVMDAAEKKFGTTQASFVWEQYTSVVKDTATEKGKIYFRRVGGDTQMAVEVLDPPKYVLLTGGKLQIYVPKSDQVMVYNLQNNQGELESFLQLGFGGGGHALLKSFEVEFGGAETVDGVETSKLNLVPKNPKALDMFPHIVLWVDPARGIAVRQQLFQKSGDYRLAIYSDIRLNEKIPESVFKLKTNSKTTFQTVSPRD
jgi:outer membrane lipoprotein-sorting protein